VVQLTFGIRDFGGNALVPHVFAFTTDVPFLNAWGTPMLLGPGSITVAHTDEESVNIAELSSAADCYARLIASV